MNVGHCGDPNPKHTKLLTKRIKYVFKLVSITL
jgi:hypothetical protein